MSAREGREESLQPRPALGQIVEAKLDNIRLETLIMILLPLNLLCYRKVGTLLA
jgi:hypothetical protein